MAQVKGEFLADFASFYDAVQKAEVSLDGLETNAAKVEKALDRATNAFSGTKLIQDATIAMEAVKALGGGVDILAGVTRLTATEQAKLNAQLTEAIAKYNALGKEAPADMVALQQATQQTKKVAEDFNQVLTVPADKVGKGQSWMNDFTGQITSMAAGMVSAQAIIGGFQAAWGSMVAFVGSSVAEFAEGEAANRKLAQSLEGLGQATPRVGAYMSDLAEQFSNTTKYSGDLITEMEALLIQVGQVLPADMQGALTAATNLASGLGIDLEQATQKVAQAFAGNAEGLKKFGINIDDARLKAEGMPYVLDEISRRFGGQAQAEMDTYAGKIAALANKWDDVKEAYGKAITESPFLAAALQLIDTQLKNATDSAEGYGSAISRNLRAGGLKGYADLVEILETLAGGYAEAGFARSQFEDKPISPNESIRLGTAADQARSLATVAEELKKAEDATKDKKKADTDAAAETKRHAEEIANLTKQLTGAGAIEQAQKYVIALKDVEDLSRLSATAQKQIAEEVGKAIEAYKRAGKEIPAEMMKIYAAVSNPGADIKVTSGLSGLPGVSVDVKDLTGHINKMFTDASAGAAKYQAEMDAMVQAYIDMQYGAKGAGEAGKGALDGMEQSAKGAKEEVQQVSVAMNQLLGVNRSAWESVAAGHELMNAYSAAGIAMGSQLAMGGYNASMRQRSGIPTSQDVYGYAPGQPSGGQPWGNSLTVNVNNADAQGIASKLVTEMRHSGYRF